MGRRKAKREDFSQGGFDGVRADGGGSDTGECRGGQRAAALGKGDRKVNRKEGMQWRLRQRESQGSRVRPVGCLSAA